MKKSTTTSKKMAKILQGKGKRRDKNSMDLLNIIVNNNPQKDVYEGPDVNTLADFPDLIPSSTSISTTVAASSSTSSLSSTNWVTKSKKLSDFNPWIKPISFPLAPMRKIYKKFIPIISQTEAEIEIDTVSPPLVQLPSFPFSPCPSTSTNSNSFVTSTDLFFKLKLIRNQNTFIPVVPVSLGFGELAHFGSSLGVTYKPDEKGPLEVLEAADEQINVDLVLESTLDELIPPSANTALLPYSNFDTLVKMREHVEILISITSRGIDGYIKNSSHWSCLLCNVNHRDIVLQPCKHQAVCQECCLRVSRCPVCKKFIKNRIISSAIPYDACDWISKLSDTPTSLLV